MTPENKPSSEPRKEPETGVPPSFAAPAAWRIDGIDARVQSRAAQAAAEANLPLAEWLTRTIDGAAAPRTSAGWGNTIGAFAAGAMFSAAGALMLIWSSGPAPSPGSLVAVAPTTTLTPAATPAPVPGNAVAPAAPTPADPTPAAVTPPAVTPAAPVQSSASAAPQPSAPATTEAPASPAVPAAPAPPPAAAAPPNPPQPAIDPADPLADLRRSANAGEAAAQFALAARYASGDGVEQDWAEAFKWFKLAAEQGMPTAQHNLAVMYERSRGTDQDLEQAAAWYEKAAEQGYPPSQFNLAVAYARGWGVQPDAAKAVTWFERAAERIPQANLALAEIFENGVGVGRDLMRARGYYQLAATAGDQRAAAKLRQLTPELVQRESLKEIQTLLAKLRYNPGPADGKLGQRTVIAIREFQRSAGVADDGRVSTELLELLRSVSNSR
jgi:localization factor PodJL